MSLGQQSLGMQLPVAKSAERVGPVSCVAVDPQVNDPAAGRVCSCVCRGVGGWRGGSGDAQRHLPPRMLALAPLWAAPLGGKRWRQ